MRLEHIMTESGNRSVNVENFFLPLGRILRAARPDFPPVFGLLLNPQTWSVQYFGVEKDGNTPSDPLVEIEEFERHFNSVYAEYHAQMKGPMTLDGLWKSFRDHMKMQNAGQSSSTKLFMAATALLSSRPIRLGCTTTDEKGPAKSSVWHLDATSEPFVFFQHALNLAAIHDFQAEGLASELGHEGSELRKPFDALPRSRPIVLEVENYVRELAPSPHHLSQETAKALIAESLYFTRGNLADDFRPSHLHHLFLPLSALGQWRGALCWLTERHRFMEDITPTLQKTFEELFTQAILDSFASRLEDALLSSQRPSREKLVTAFATLWWADEISFILDEVSGDSSYTDIARRSRNTGSLSRWTGDCDSPSPSSGRFLSESSDDQTTRCVEIDLKYLGTQVRGSAEPPAFDQFRDILGFSRIRISFHLQNSKVDTSSYAGAIAHRISTVIETLMTLRIKTEFQTLEAVGHTIMNSVRSTGWALSLVELKEAGLDHPAVERAIRSLSLYELPEGVNSLIRLASLTFSGELQKIGGWANAATLRAWSDGGDAVLLKYAAYVREFVASLCYGMNKTTGFRLRVTSANETLSEDTVSTESPPERSLDGWFWDLDYLPPLSLQESHDSHLALLATLIEPVCNAIKYLNRKGLRGLYINVQADFPDAVVVCIGNDAHDPPDELPPGLRQAQTFFGWTTLATVEHLKESAPIFSDESSVDQYWVAVRLHPQHLAERIVNQPDSN